MNQPEFPNGTYDSVCPLDCADTCSLSIDVIEGQVAKVRGSHANPFTRGKICAKVATGLPIQVHGADRLSTPLLRNGPKGAGAYRTASWDEALDTIHQRFSEIIAKYGHRHWRRSPTAALWACWLAPVCPTGFFTNSVPAESIRSHCAPPPPPPHGRAFLAIPAASVTKS